MRAGYAMRSLNTAKASTAAATRLLSSSTAQRVIEIVFGLHAKPGAAPSRTQLAKIVFDNFSYPIRTSQCDGRLCDIGVVSHVRAQARAIPALFNGRQLGIYSCVMDDANMWVQPPKPELRKVIRIGMDGKKKVRIRGRNRCLPALSLVQHAFAAAPDGKLAGSSITSPSQSMPKQNWKTVHDCFAKWALNSKGNVGSSLDPSSSGQAQAAVDAVLHFVSLFTKDGLQMNECLVREEQDGSSNRVPPGGSRSVLDVTCFSHKACLCTRSAYREGIVGKLRTALLRLGHLMQSGEIPMTTTVP